VENIRTVSEAKRDFYKYHTRPINSIYRRVVEELMVEMHLLSVNVDFRPDPIYYVGVCQSFEQFMTGYLPEADKNSIFRALCQSVGGNFEEYRNQASILLNYASQTSPPELVSWLLSPTNVNISPDLEAMAYSWREKMNRDRFKYSRLFAVGLYSLLGKNEPDLIKDKEKINKLLAPLIEKLKLPADKLEKDWDLYASNLEKMTQMLAVLEDTMKASKQKKLEKQEIKN
jgi:photosystem II biogenesis protein Psp29